MGVVIETKHPPLHAATSLLRRVRKPDTVKRLDDVASIRVGVVTGANRHFIRSRDALDALNVVEAAEVEVDGVREALPIPNRDVYIEDHANHRKEDAAELLGTRTQR